MGLVWSMQQTGEPLPPGTPFDQVAVQTPHLRAAAVGHWPAVLAFLDEARHAVRPQIRESAT